MTVIDEPTADLIARDPGLAALSLLADPGALAERVGAPVVVHRLRYKPATAVHAAVSAPPAGRWYLLAGYGAAGRPKLAKDHAAARRRGLTVIAADPERWLLVPAAADRALSRRALALTAPEATAVSTLAYDPRRRLVLAGDGAEGPWVAKVYAPGQRRVAGSLTAAIRQAGVLTPPARPAAHPAVRVTDWCRGRPADPTIDAGAVGATLDRLAAARPAVALPTLTAPSLLRRVDAALRFVAGVLPRQHSVAAALRRSLHERAAALIPRVGVPAHGDLSADQVIIDDAGRAWLLDLDGCCYGPAGWDHASWLAAQLAAGVAGPTPLPGSPPPPVVRAAALALRAPEPFARQRPGWADTTIALLAAATAAAERSPVASIGPR